MKSWYIDNSKEGLPPKQIQELLDLAVDCGVEASDGVVGEAYLDTYNAEFSLREYPLVGISTENETTLHGTPDVFEEELTYYEAKDYLKGMRDYEILKRCKRDEVKSLISKVKGFIEEIEDAIETGGI